MEILLKARMIYPPWVMEKQPVSIVVVSLPRAGRVDFACDLSPQFLRERRIALQPEKIVRYLDPYGADAEVRDDEYLATFEMGGGTAVYRIRIGEEILDVPETEFPVPLILPIRDS